MQVEHIAELSASQAAAAAAAGGRGAAGGKRAAAECSRRDGTAEDAPAAAKKLRVRCAEHADN